jgi:hypothetical protein
MGITNEDDKKVKLRSLRPKERGQMKKDAQEREVKG